MFKRVFVLCLVLSGVYCAENNYDVDIFFASLGNPGCHVFFNKGDISVHATDTGKTQDLRDLLYEMVWEGYYFCSSISEENKSNPLLYVEGVREAVCFKKEFYSKRMRDRLSLVADALCSGVCQGVEKHMLAAQSLKELCDEKNTLIWHVGFKPLRCVAVSCVKIFFRGSHAALIGRLDSGRVKHGRGFESLLRVKRRLIDAQENPCAAKSIRSPETSVMSSFEQFISHGLCDPQRGVGLVYFPEGGGQVSALFDVTGMTMQAEGPEGAQGTQNLFDVMFEQIFKGYVFKDDVTSYLLQKHQTDYGVCETLCDKVPFLSQSLRDALAFLANSADGPERIVSEKGWGGLEPCHLHEAYSEQKTLQWIPVDKDCVLECVAQNRCDPGTAFLSLNGYPAVLQGCPTIVDANTDESVVNARCMWCNIQETQKGLLSQISKHL